MDELNDADALRLIRTRKTFMEPLPLIKLVSGSRKHYDLKSVESKGDRFILDITMSSVVVKYTYHLSSNISVTLLRLDVGGNHVNPDTAGLVLPPDDPFYGIHGEYIGHKFIKECFRKEIN